MSRDSVKEMKREEKVHYEDVGGSDHAVGETISL